MQKYITISFIIYQVIYQATSTIAADPDLTNASHVDHFTITDLRVNLLRLQSLSGNDPPGPEAITRRYYSINHIEVYGWCFCNGHENTCLPLDDDTDGMVSEASSIILVITSNKNHIHDL